MTTYIRCKQHKIQHQNIKQLEHEQEYRFRMISNIKLLGAEIDFTGA